MFIRQSTLHLMLLPHMHQTRSSQSCLDLATNGGATATKAGRKAQRDGRLVRTIAHMKTEAVG